MTALNEKLDEIQKRHDEDEARSPEYCDRWRNTYQVNVSFQAAHADRAELLDMVRQSSPVAAGGGWRPISECDVEDYRSVDLYFCGERMPGTDPYRIPDAYRVGENWFSRGHSMLKYPPTHWQPLPTPPEDK